MPTDIVIRNSRVTDRDFIFGLSPSLAEVAGLAWHSDCIVQKMQHDYITDVLDNMADAQITLIAQKNAVSLGFLHACARIDGVSGETCGTVTLLAVVPAAQSMGIGQLLMSAAEVWAKEQGYRLLHLEVFANNDKAYNFYHKLGFKAEMLHMIKPL